MARVEEDSGAQVPLGPDGGGVRRRLLARHVGPPRRAPPPPHQKDLRILRHSLFETGEPPFLMKSIISTIFIPMSLYLSLLTFNCRLPIGLIAFIIISFVDFTSISNGI